MSASAAIAFSKVSGGSSTALAAWQTWSPTLTNLSGGTQTYAKYVQIGKTVHFRFKYVLAGAGVAGAVSFTLPVTASSDYSATDAEAMASTVSLRDTGTGVYQGTLRFASTTSVSLYALNAGGTYTVLSSLSSTVPHTWATTDVIMVAGSYEAA